MADDTGADEPWESGLDGQIRVMRDGRWVWEDPPPTGAFSEFVGEVLDRLDAIEAQLGMKR